MTGIERLLDWVGTLRLSGLVWADEMADELESTVDLIKREHAEDCCKMGLDYGAVSRVTADMERHVLGHEGMEDSPVARWARELRGAIDGADEEDEAREAAEWVREHGGLDAVDAIWDNDVQLAEAVISELWPDGRPDECGNDDVMGELRRRLMPEGYDWPRYESGEPVEVWDEVSVTVHDEDGDFERTMAAEFVSFSGHDVIISDPCHVVRLLSGERVRRPEPPDSWERIEEDKDLNPFDYCKKVGHKLWTFDNAEEFKASDLVRRCRALAERERGE